MTGGPDPDDRKPMVWDGLHGKWWQRVAALVHLRRHNAQVLGRGTTQLEVTTSGLLKVTRRCDTECLCGWFNTMAKPHPLAAKAVLAQGFTAGTLAPEGFVIGTAEA